MEREGEKRLHALIIFGHNNTGLMRALNEKFNNIAPAAVDAAAAAALDDDGDVAEGNSELISARRIRFDIVSRRPLCSAEKKK